MSRLGASSPQRFYPGYTRPSWLTVLPLFYWATAAGAIIFGAGVLIDLIFLTGLRSLAIALLAVLAAGPIVMGALQAIVGMFLFSLRRMAWATAMALSLIQVFVSMALIIVGYLLISRPLQGGGIGDLLSDAGVAFPVYGAVAWESIVAIFLSVLTLGYLSRSHVRTIFGPLRLRPYRTTPSQPRGGGVTQGAVQQPPSAPGYNPFFPGYPMMGFPLPIFPPPPQPSGPAQGPPADRAQAEKFCRHCGVRVRRAASYCVSCGSRLS